MTDPKDKKEKIGETCKKHLIEVFISTYYGRHKELHSKWLKKGNEVENESIRLYNSISNKKYTKNTQTIKNEYIIGTPDIIDDIIGEAKSSFDIWTFLSAKHGKLDMDYYWQTQGYMWLTGLKSARLFYALCNTPCELILDEKRKLAWRLKSIDEETDEYIDGCRSIERNAIYDIETFKYDNPYFDFHNDIEYWKWDIPAKDRLHCIDINYDPSAIDKLKYRIDACREWINDNLINVPDWTDIEGI